jgi:hypothetical protein
MFLLGFSLLLFSWSATADFVSSQTRVIELLGKDSKSAANALFFVEYFYPTLFC